MVTTVNNTVIIVKFRSCRQVWRLGPLDGGSTFARIFLKRWFNCETFHSIHLRAYISQVHVNVTTALIVFY